MSLNTSSLSRERNRVRRAAPGWLVLLGLLAGLPLIVGCPGPPRFGAPGEPLERAGDEIVVCGRLFHTGAPVVLWLDPGGYDAYRAHCRFDPQRWKPTRPVSSAPVRYGSFRRHLPDELARQVVAEGWTVPRLARVVDLFVYHYDACGTSRRCFRVLHDIRGLSVHFMLDVDGTIYQTLDVKERAWHAGKANDRSVGVEIANIGAYAELARLEQWYTRDADGRWRLAFPDDFADAVWRTPDFVPRPARNEPIWGEINGQRLVQFDLTDAQYESLIKLTAALCRVLPRIEPDYPRDADGRLLTRAMSAEELAAYHGLLGHYHITTRKFDPGPAFDWERVVAGVRRELN